MPRNTGKRPRITLLNLLLITATASVLVALFSSHRANRHLRTEHAEREAELQADLSAILEESAELRAEQGALTIEDPTKVHAIRTPRAFDDERSYRVYLPEGNGYYIGQQVGQLPTGDEKPRFGFDSEEYGNFNVVGGLENGARQRCRELSSGEHLVGFGIRRRRDGSATISLTIDGTIMSSSEFTSGWPADSDEGGWNSAYREIGGQVSCSPDKLPLVLYHERATLGESVSLEHSSDGKNEGIIFWIGSTDGNASN